MVRKEISAIAAALSICAMASSTVHAETAMPKPDAMNVPHGKGSLISTVTSFFDGFADERSEHKHHAYSSPAREAFAGPYNLLVTGTADQNSYGMILASMGLMALIAHRRRMMS